MDFNFLGELGPQGMLVLAIWFAMMFIKNIPFVPKWIRPFIACAMGAAGWLFVGDPGSVPYKMRNPEVSLALHGFLIGALAACSNNGLQLFLKRKGASIDDTETINKDDISTYE